jgi:hypothetical protein
MKRINSGGPEERAGRRGRDVINVVTEERPPAVEKLSRQQKDSGS